MLVTEIKTRGGKRGVHKTFLLPVAFNATKWLNNGLLENKTQRREGFLRTQIVEMRKLEVDYRTVHQSTE